MKPWWPLLALTVVTPAQALPDFAAVRAAHRSSDAWLLARDGREVQQLRLDMGVRRLPWLPLAEVSPALTAALLVSEDRRFFDHTGVDWKAVAAAGWGNLGGPRQRGASTLSMQLAGLLDGNLPTNGRRSLWQKFGQMTDALRLEQSWSKEEILEAYLNLAPFRGELQGVAAMAQGLFGKRPDGLDLRESALAAALLRGPNAKPGQVALRACGVLKTLAPQADCAGLGEQAATALRPPYRLAANAGNAANIAPHLARRLLGKPGERRASTLDADLQAFAVDTLRAHLRHLARDNVADGAVVVLDNASGEVRAWVGSSGDLSAAAEVDGVTALRQAGSTLKPFLYALAIEQRYLTAASLLDDSPLRIASPLGLYVPQNYDRRFKGLVSVRLALGSSLNVPAVRTLIRVGPDAFFQRLKALGIDSLRESGDYYGYSLALGSADVSLLALTNAYRALANRGCAAPPRLLPEADDVGNIGPCRQVVAAPAAAIVADVLADRAARIYTFGLDSVLATRYWAAAKTGTSKDMRDNWALGFTPRYTVGVWVGNADGAPMHDVSGVTGAAPVWREIIDWLSKRDGIARPPALPKDVVVTPIRYQPAVEPPRREIFVSGSERSTILLTDAAAMRVDGRGKNSGDAPARIAYPGEGTIIALDADIPPARQRVFFQATGGAATWQLDSQPIKAASRAGWLPQPGRHRLALIDAAGDEVDAVGFEVRGLPRGRVGGREQSASGPEVR